MTVKLFEVGLLRRSKWEEWKGEGRRGGGGGGEWDEGCCCCWLAAKRPSNMLVYLRDLLRQFYVLPH